MGRKVIIVIEGGAVQRVLVDGKDTEVVIIDHDTEGVPEQELQTIHEDGEIYSAKVWQDGDYVPEKVSKITGQIVL